MLQWCHRFMRDLATKHHSTRSAAKCLQLCSNARGDKIETTDLQMSRVFAKHDSHEHKNQVANKTRIARRSGLAGGGRSTTNNPSVATIEAEAEAER